MSPLGQSRARDVDFRFTLDSGSLFGVDKWIHAPAERHLSSAASSARMTRMGGTRQEHPATAKCGPGQGQSVLWCRTGSRPALLNDERRNEFQWDGAVVKADVNLASINI